MMLFLQSPRKWKSIAHSELLFLTNLKNSGKDFMLEAIDVLKGVSKHPKKNNPAS